MLASFASLRTLAILAAAVPIAASSGMTQDDGAATRAANQSAQRVQPTATPVNNAALASAIAQWKAVQQTDALPFDSYASFMLIHPGWPGEAAVRRAAERQSGNAAPASLVAFFRRYPPQSATAGVRYALALAAVGQSDAALDAARTAWRKGSLAPTDEAALLSSFGSYLSPADHDARMDALLWAGQTTAAAREIAFVSPERRAVFEARLALRTNAPDAQAKASAAGSAAEGDAGYVADYARWLQASGAGGSVRSWFATTRTITRPPAAIEAYLEARLAAAKGAATDGNWQQAYDVARQVDGVFPASADIALRPYGERDDYTSLVWLAGTTALNKLGRPADAMPMFERYAQGSRNPIVQSKGWYWTARAAESAGRQADAQAWLVRAAGLRDQYYGQLANERLGRALAPPPPFLPQPVDPAIRAAFYAREVVQVAQFLGTIGDWQDQTAFVRQIAMDAKGDADHVLAEELSRTIDRPGLGVMVGRSALANGLTEYSLAGFPTVQVPDDLASYWTMIHAIARQESQFDRAAISRTGARGLMQLMPATGREAAAKLSLPYDQQKLIDDPVFNVRLGSSYFARIYERYGSYPMAIAAYNAGPGNVNKWLAANGDPRTPGVDPVAWVEAIPFTETRGYVQRVLENAVVYDLINPQRARSRGPANLSWYLGKQQPG